MSKKRRGYNGSFKKRKRNFFHRAILRNELTCVYCGQTDLVTLWHNDPEIPKYRRATIDHVVPISKGGSTLQTNWAICCEECNIKKGDKIW